MIEELASGLLILGGISALVCGWGAVVIVVLSRALNEEE